MNARLFLAARVHAFTNQLPSANAVLVLGDRIVEVGAADRLRGAHPTAAVIDLGDVVITPGLTDAHIHITEWAIARQHVQLGRARTIEECLELIARAPAAGSWLQGRGWNPHQWGGAYPDRHQLDGIVSDRPAAFQSHDMHALWVNSAALRHAGIDAATPDPAGGRIVRDDRGEPTGMLLETAAQLAISRIPLVTEAELRAAVIDAQLELHSYGVTGVHSLPGVHLPKPEPLAILQQLVEQNALRLRVLQHISADQLADAVRLGIRSGFGDGLIRIGGVKLFLDGALGSRTAWMREPYEGSTERGVEVMPEREFRDIVRRAAQAGIATVVHAIGDAAVARAFDVLSAAPAVPAIPHRIEHVQCLPLDRAPLLGRGIVCSVQPCHLMSDWRAADRHWGKRSAATYAFRTMLDGGAVLACGSDAPVESADPRLGFYAAVARRDSAHEPAQGWQAGQALTIDEVMAGYTRGPALAAGAAETQGILRPGAYADFAAWKTDPLLCNGPELLELEVAATIVAGQVVWQV